MLKFPVGLAMIVADIWVAKVEIFARHATVHGHPAPATGAWILAAVTLIINAVVWTWVLRDGKKPAAQPARQGSYMSRWQR